MSRHHTTIRVNPRSTGISTTETYEKHSNLLNLKPEAQELARCNQLGIQTDHVKPIDLISFDESANRITTRKITAKELFHTIWNPTSLLGHFQGHRLTRPDIVRARIIETGVWLRKYHESSANYLPGVANGCWLETDFHRKIMDIRKHRLVPEAKLKKIELKFGLELKKIKQPGYLEANGGFACRTHGDFTIYNMLIDPDMKIHILDFGDTRISVNLEDVGRFYSSVWAIAHTNRARHKLFASLPSEFLKAYGISPDIAGTAYFRCILAYNFLIHLEGQFYMKSMLSWNSNREMSQISRAGMNWIYQQI